MKSNLKIALLVVSLMGSSQVFAQECKATWGFVPPNFCEVNLKDGNPVNVTVTGFSTSVKKYIFCIFENASEKNVTFSATGINLSGVVLGNNHEGEGTWAEEQRHFTFKFSADKDPNSPPFRFACTETGAVK